MVSSSPGAQDSASQYQNRCFTYPQGQASIIPQTLTLMAFIASLLVWPFFGYSVYFMCIEVEISGTSSTSESLCSPLRLTDPEYWSYPDEKGWAAAIQAGAVFAILSSILGFVAFSLLLTATCFVLTPRKIMAIAILQGIAAFFIILSLIAGAVDECRFVGELSAFLDCNDRMRVETGAGFAIFSFILYIPAIVFTVLWYRQVTRDSLTPQEDETEAFITNKPAPPMDDTQGDDNRVIQMTEEPMTQSAPPLRSQEEPFNPQYMAQSAPPQQHTTIPQGHNDEMEYRGSNYGVDYVDETEGRDYVDETGQVLQEDSKKHHRHSRHGHRHRHRHRHRGMEDDGLGKRENVSHDEY